MQECIFCKIVKGEIPSAKVFENNKVLAFLDISPASKGHTLVIPKVHHESFVDMSKDDLSELMEIVKKIAPSVVKGVAADGFNLGVNNGTAAGQIVMHAHFHIIPRKKGDGLMNWPQSRYDPGEMEKVKESIIVSLKK